ncbi:hypothetical protein CTheo_3819 [Ceratobasidium theobromae]|uniref:Uncharacterized protein n=1 Tax=Ceratobasidium theobromae TaxID=1582974 RepID=A0A5N5QMK5_9AGAM|nr:hypothetical protein CTheo_3819 [Ceratobasidium theobromae]
MGILDSDNSLPRVIRQVLSKKEPQGPPVEGYPLDQPVTYGPVTVGHQPHARRDYRGRKNSEVDVYGRPRRSRSASGQEDHIRGEELLAMSRALHSRKKSESKLDLNEFIARNERQTWHSSPGAVAERRLKQELKELHKAGKLGPPQVGPPKLGYFVHRPVNSDGSGGSSSRFQGC